MRLCSPQLGISPEATLGGEVHDRDMLKALDKLGTEISIILPWGKKCPLFKHAKIYFLPTPVVYPPWFFNFLILPYLFWICWRRPFEVLRVHSPSCVGPAAIFFQLFHPEVKLVVTYHHLDKNLNFVDKFLLSKFDLVITVSEETRKELGCGVVIPNGVAAKFRPQKKREKLIKKYYLNGKRILLYLGQLSARKNIPFLFKVLEKLPDRYVLVVCGDGPLRQELEKAAPKGVIFAGKIPEEEKVAYYNLADVFVYPSLKEGFGLSVAEAIACGKQVVASNTPIVENTPLDVNAWVKKIKNPAPIKKINYTWEKSAKMLLDKLEEL